MCSVGMIISIFCLLIEYSDLASGKVSFKLKAEDPKFWDVFSISENHASWKEAKQQCNPGVLAKYPLFSDSKQYLEVLHYVSENYVNEEFWVGYTDQYTEGEWDISNPGEWPWSGTDTDMKDNNLDCMILKSGGSYADANCNIKKRYICIEASVRDDGRCGKNYAAPNGEWGRCGYATNNNGCCNATGHCEPYGRCDCSACIYYGPQIAGSGTVGCTFCDKNKVWDHNKKKAVPDWSKSTTTPTSIDDWE